MPRSSVLSLLGLAACGTEPTPSTGTTPAETPAAPVVTVTPVLPAANVDLVCAAVADDPAATLSYAWSVDGVAVQNPTDTVPAADTTAGEVWTCEAVATVDGVASAPGSAAVTVATVDPVVLQACGAVGATGPNAAMCAAAYAGQPFADDIVVQAGIQRWVVPATGLYRISVAGARGGSGHATFVGGAGAIVVGALPLAAGDELSIAVGQPGTGNDFGGSGGGASWVVRGDDEPLVVAGGGGGACFAAERDGCGAGVEESAGLGSGGFVTTDCAPIGADSGQGGGASTAGTGAGGGGLLGPGADDVVNGFTAGGGADWAGGVLGGASDGTASLSAPGGFGGGGAVFAGGGGGGGYSGGGGGCVAGGGGSFVAGGALTGYPGSNGGDGWVDLRLEGE